MMKKFKKGFSLVELLVVIAIIGILAAVGITAYSGYTSNAKIKASTSNHSSIVALLNSEMAKCASGAGNYSWGDPCDDEAVTHANITTYNTNTLGLKNPYETDKDAIVHGNDSVTTQGYTDVNCTGTRAARDINCKVSTLLKENGTTLTGNVAGY